MVLNNVPPLTETRARPSMRFSSSNYTYSIWIQIMQFKLGLPARLTLQLVLTEKPYPRISESSSRLLGGDGQSCPCHLLHGCCPLSLCFSFFSFPAVFLPMTVIVKKGGSFSCRSPVFYADLMEAVPRGKHLKPTATVTALEHHILGLPIEGRAKWD